MADRGLVARMVEDGWDRDAAAENVDALVNTIVAQLHSGKSVQLEGVGILRAPTMVAKAGYPPNTLREQRKVQLKNGAIVTQGEPYPDPRAPIKARSTYGR